MYLNVKNDYVVHNINATIVKYFDDLANILKLACVDMVNT